MTLPGLLRCSVCSWSLSEGLGLAPLFHDGFYLGVYWSCLVLFDFTVFGSCMKIDRSKLVGLWSHWCLVMEDVPCGLPWHQSSSTHHVREVEKKLCCSCHVCMASLTISSPPSSLSILFPTFVWDLWMPAGVFFFWVFVFGWLYLRCKNTFWMNYKCSKKRSNNVWIVKKSMITDNITIYFFF